MEIADITSFERRNDGKSSCTTYVVLIAIVLTITIGTGTYLFTTST